MKLLITGFYKYTDSQIKQLEAVGYDITFVQYEIVSLDK